MEENRQVTLTDLLNNDARAYRYFYDLPPEVQNTLWQKDIQNFAQLAQAVAEIDLHGRPPAF